MIKRISAVALCVSLLSPSPVFAQALRVAVEAPMVTPSARVIPLFPSVSALTPAALTPLALTASLPSPVAAPIAAPVAAIQAQPLPLEARPQIVALGVRLTTAKTPDAELARSFDGALNAANENSFRVPEARLPAPPRRGLLQRASAFGAMAATAIVPAVQNAVAPAAQHASSFPTWAGFAILGASIVGLLFTVRWIESSKTVQFYLARRRWVTANERKWKDATDAEKAMVEGEADRIISNNIAGRWPGNRNKSEPISIHPDRQAPSTEDSFYNPEPARKPKKGEVAGPKVITFADVAGQEDAKRELKKVVDYIKNPEPYNRLGAKGFKGVLMFGPPGTGKTLIARAVAGEAGATFHETNGSEFVNTYVGKGPSNIRAAFAKARGDGKKPGILFIDEIDAVGKKRSDGDGNQEYENTLNALLAEMSSPENAKIVVIAATNRPELLDAALMRGRRFGLKVPVGLPDIQGREAILKVHSKGMPLASDGILAKVAELTPGLSGADLEEIINDAAMLAAERGGTDVNETDFRKAVERTTIGHERKLAMSPVEKKIVANHESGHALVAWLVPNGDQIRKITIVPHGLQALGLVQTLAAEEKHLYSKSWLEDRIAIALGGRVAEQMTTGETYSGAQNDFEQATRMARMMVMKFGMSEKVGHVSYDMEGERPAVGRAQSEKQRELIDAEVRRIIDEQSERVVKMLTEHRAYLDGMADELMTKETLREDDLARLLPPRPKKS